MRIHQTLLTLFVGSFIIQYFLLPPIMVDKRQNITNNMSKAYISTIFALFIIMLFMMIHDTQYKTISYKYYTAIGICLVLFIYFYRKQMYVNDKQYLEAMIENNANTLLMSNKILEKTDDYNVIKLAKNIIQIQKDELSKTREILAKKNITQ
jgi:Ca2+/Na+ antiporter